MDVANDYFEISKPGILLLLVVAGACAAYIASPARFPWRTAAITLLGGALASASASALNNVLERELDAQMARTALRPIPAHRLPASNALTFAAVAAVISFVLLAKWVNLLTAGLALSGLLFYVLIYTVWLKRRTPQNIVIGGGAGSFAALVGWAGITNNIGPVPLLMGALIFLWTPPHFWSLALVHVDDYERAGFPMLPVVRGPASTKRQIAVYAVLTLVASLLLVWPLGALGALYAGAALALGGIFVYLSFRLIRTSQETRVARQLFGYSILYLGLLFGAMVLDRMVPVALR
jgi:protoheme IX farnesyltransferase